MNWWRSTPRLGEELRQRLAALPTPQPLDERPLAAQRLVVFDLETSGLNVRRDRLLAIGAVALEGGALALGDSFEATLRVPEAAATSSVLIHGLAPSALADGQAPAEALLDWLEYLGDSPLLAFHAGFDQAVLDRALRRHLGMRLRHPVLDLAELAPMLLPDCRPGRDDLDDWCALFGLHASQRHQALADAQVTAELALILLHRARHLGLDSPTALARRLDIWRRRQTQAI